NISLDFFPEGGDLVSNIDSKVAFKALNEFGKPADIEGIVTDSKGFVVASFSSFHQGMGAFNFKPLKGERYVAKITKPEGITEVYKLPETFDRGYVMNVENSKAGELGLNINSTENDEMAIVAQVRGKIYYSTIVRPIDGKSQFSFSTEQFPAGVSQITLFDSKGIARAERLVFVNKNKQLNISVSTEKEKYLPREKVKMTLTVKDERGLPMPANLCVSVVNDQLLSFADDKSGNIMSELLLQQDLKEKVEEPSFYFDKKENKADQALDYLLLTSGWRRFTWEKLLEEDLPVLSYMGQKAVLGGQVFGNDNNNVPKNIKIKSSTGKEFPVSENGSFKITGIDLSEPQNLTFSADGYFPQVQYINEYNQDLSVYLYKQGRPYYSRNRAKSGAGAKPEVFAERDLMVNAPEEAMAVEAAPVLAMEDIKKDLKAAKPSPKKKVEEKTADKMEAAPAKEEVNLGEIEIVDARSAGFARNVKNIGIDDIAQGSKYYRARQFPIPTYENSTNVELRTDFRNTIYWNSNVEIGFSGKKTIEFYTSDDITSFRTTVEGINTNGDVGRVEETFFTQLPFSMTTKIPVEVATEDLLSIPLTLKNNTNGPLGGQLTVKTPEGFIGVVATPSLQTIMPGKSKTVYLDYKISEKIGEGDFVVSFNSCGLSDAFSQKMKIVPKGFPVKTSFSSQDMEREYSFTIHHQVAGSLKASFTAFPNVVSDLMKGVEGILQEPYGCFEQTSCTAYPNAMVLDYLKSTDSKDDRSLARANDLLNRGYKRLTTFETPNRGYEWFGASPAHEGLTAYGIMEFVDMQKAGQAVDQKMLDRTATWLLNHKDGKGGFQREQRALHDFGRISDDVMNGYIVYALTEAGYSDLKKEFETSFAKALESKDAYLLAMAANSAFSIKENNKGNEILKVLLSKQAENGSFTGSSHSITYSQGSSLSIETTALTIMAILKSSDKNMKSLSQAVQYLVSSRSGSGAFSSTQGTILALKALTTYAKFTKRASESGTVVIYIDDKKVAERSYKDGDQGTINLEGLEQHIKGEGVHHVKVKYLGVKNPLPYSISVNWSTSLPNSDKDCSIGLSTKLSSQTLSVGETTRLTASISNRRNVEVPSTMAIIGIPAGLSVQPWQLKELQEKKVFDYYEIKGNNVAFYYRGLAPGAIKEIKLDLKAEIPGEYDAPASSAYLYYTNEFKTWSALEKVTVKKANNSHQ
ncbi:MAG: hypothetical protein JNL60_16125, partial [Bacteroidia bacterium]|nr:hypothetical protein [Bacteroidia bacterium]